MKRIISLFAVAVLVAFATPAAANFTATGTFQYEDLPIDIDGFQNPHVNRPCRFIDVQVIDNQTSAVLAEGATDANGFFSIPVTDALVRNIAIMTITRSFQTPNLNYYVTQWNSTAYHAFQGILVSGHNPNTDINMGTAVAHYHGGGEALNIYDVSYDVSDCVGSMEGGTRPGGYRVRYTLNVSNDQAYWNGVVNIGGNFGYDDTIIMHESGHCMTAIYGDWSDSPGGTHYIDDSAQDPRLSWGEGYPTFFAANVRDWAGYAHPQVYLNSTGDSTHGVISFSYDMETHSGGGASDEGAVQCCLWDLTDGDSTPDNTPGADDEAGYQMDRTFPELWSFIRTYLSQPPFVGTQSYEDFSELWIANAVNPQSAAFGDIENNNHGIQYRDDAFENDDTFASAGTYHTFEDIGLGRKSHHTTWPQGDLDWVKFQGLANITYTVNTTTMRDGADTFVDVLNSAQTVLASNDNYATPTPGTYNAYENLRSSTQYMPTTTQDLWVRVKRSTSSWGQWCKYGNWDLQIQATAVPNTYPNITTNPSITLADTLQQNTQGTKNLIIGNTGTVDPLIFNLVEASGPIGWISESPTTDTVPAGSNRTSVITFDATGLAVGVYRDTLEVHSNDPNRPLKYMQLILTVEPGGVDAVGGATAQYATWLGANTPNPSRPATAIRYAVAKTGPASLVIYDVQGREVRRLVDGVQQAGEHSATWNGSDQNGRQVSSGIYYYRLVAAGQTFTRSLVMTK